MAFILRSTRLLYNLVGFTRRANTIVGRKKEFVFGECQKILNFNELRVRTIALSAEEKEEDLLKFNSNIENEIQKLNMSVKKRLVYKKNILSVFEGLKQNGEITYSQMLLLLNCCTDVSFMCSEEERVQMALDFWRTGVELGTKLHDSHYNALLTVFVENNHKFSCRSFLNDMKNADVEPNLVTYRRLLRASCQQCDVVGTKELLDEMKSLNHPLNVSDFNSLILCYSKTGNFEKADEIFKVMEERSIEPTSESYIFLLCGYIENGNFEKFEETLNQLTEKENFLSDADLLEIFYTLAKKKEMNFSDTVLKRFPRKSNFELLLEKFLHRLLHRKLDSAAFRLLETINVTNKAFSYGNNVTRHLLDHFVHYRQPNEILKICEKLESRGYVTGAAPYSLKKSFSLRDEYFSLEIINEMRARNIPVKDHYYWPILIKLSKKGNKSMLSVLNKLPASTCRKVDTIINIILPNYEFSNNLDADIEKLAKIGIEKAYVTWHCLVKFLQEKNIDRADHIVAMYPVRPMKLKHVFNSLFTCLAKHPEKVDQVVNIMYNLYHDTCFETSKKDVEELDDELEKPMKYFDMAVHYLLEKSQKDEVILRVLEGFLEKKMGISSATGSKIIESFQNQTIEELVRKLTDPNLKFKLDETLVNLKSRKPRNVDHSSTFPNDDKETVNPNSFASLKDCVYHMMRLARRKEFEKAIEVGEQFAQQNEDSTVPSQINVKEMYKFCLNQVSALKDVTLVNKFYDLGMRLGVLSKNKRSDFGLLLILYLKCGNVSKALENFKEYLLNKGEVVVAVELLIKCISEGKNEAVQQITELISENRSRNVALSHLVIALTTVGEIEKATKLLNSAEFEFSKNLFLRKLRTWQKVKNSADIEKFVVVLKNLKDFDYGITLLYKLLAQKYAVENKVDKIKQLCLEVQDKNIMDQEFLEQLSKFQENPDTADLSNSVKIDVPQFQRRNSKQNTNINLLMGVSQNSLSEEHILAMNDRVPHPKALFLAVKFASLGDVGRTCSIVEKYSMGKDTRKVATAFLRSKNVNKYFEFLNFFASKGDFTIISDCFGVACLIPALKKNDEYFKKYKSLVFQCADETHFSTPVISCFVNCAKLPGKLSDAEEIFDKYSNYFKNLPFSHISEAVEMTELSSSFYENILSSKKLKDHFSDHLHEFYNKLITSYAEDNKLDNALIYLNMAVGDGVEKRLEKSSMALLKSKLEQQGKNFPYPELNSD